MRTSTSTGSREITSQFTPTWRFLFRVLGCQADRDGNAERVRDFSLDITHAAPTCAVLRVMGCIHNRPVTQPHK